MRKLIYESKKGSGNMKKAFCIISNILSVFLIGPFSLYFSALGCMFITSINFDWTFICMINLILSVAFLCALPLCIIGIILSIAFRGKEKYKESFLIQLLPFASVIVGIFLFVVSMFWSNP